MESQSIKRPGKQIIKEAALLMWRDMKDYKGVWITIIIYFIVIRTFSDTSCALVEMTGYPCPACGLTRAGVSVLHGDFHTAWQIHWFIYPVIVLAGIAVIRRYFLRQSNQSLKKWLIFLVLCMIIYYVYRMWRYFPGQPPMSYYKGNWLRTILRLVQK